MESAGKRKPSSSETIAVSNRNPTLPPIYFFILFFLLLHSTATHALLSSTLFFHPHPTSLNTAAAMSWTCAEATIQ
jgi:hypothetical protein